MESGVGQGRRPELVGGGLIRGLGGWEEVKKRGRDRVKGDERMLGDINFVMHVLKMAEERFTRSYELKSQGYDLDSIERRVCEIYRIEPDDMYSTGGQKVRADARGLYCYWVVRELGYEPTTIARRLGTGVLVCPEVGYGLEEVSR